MSLVLSEKSRQWRDTYTWKHSCKTFQFSMGRITTTGANKWRWCLVSKIYGIWCRMGYNPLVIVPLMKKKLRTRRRRKIIRFCSLFINVWYLTTLRRLVIQMEENHKVKAVLQNIRTLIAIVVVLMEIYRWKENIWQE